MINLDKRQYLHPHRFGEGMKLLEFGCSSVGTMTALAVLLSQGNGLGGGDLHSENPIIGSWSGDYADSGLYDKAVHEFEEISTQILVALMDDAYIAQELRQRAQRNYFGMELPA